MRYEPSLDGLRALAVLIVMAFHARITHAQGGFLGVDMFFVLSGYLITRMLADEHARTGTLRVGYFYLRRLRRLYPALILMLAIYVAVAPWLFSSDRDHGREALVAALYLSDYGFAFWKTPWFVQHTWSLAVEEHFYLMWPPLLCLILRLPPRYWAPTLFLLFVGATIWRWYVVLNISPWHQPYFRFDTRLSGLLLGATAALTPVRAPRSIALLGAMFLLYAMYQATAQTDAALMKWMLLAELGSLMLVLAAPNVSILSIPALTWLGRLSYGLYLWHFPVMLWLRYQQITGWPALLIGGAISLACATASYYSVERWARQRRLKQPSGSN